MVDARSVKRGRGVVLFRNSEGILYQTRIARRTVCARWCSSDLD